MAFDVTRKQDIKDIQGAMRSNNPRVRESAKNALGKISRQSNEVTELRNNLSVARRRGDHDKADKILDRLTKDPSLHNR